jgi:hypothetical protein
MATIGMPVLIHIAVYITDPQCCPNVHQKCMPIVAFAALID